MDIYPPLSPTVFTIAMFMRRLSLPRLTVLAQLLTSTYHDGNAKIETIESIHKNKSWPSLIVSLWASCRDLEMPSLERRLEMYFSEFLVAKTQFKQPGASWVNSFVAA